MSAGLQRRKQILALISRDGYESVQTLAATLGVSEMTIRRDLDEIERQGLIRRTHGGATSEGFSQIELDFRVREQVNPDAKRRIAEEASRHVQDGDVLFLDSGTTILAMTPFLLNRRGLTVVTPSLPIARDLAGRSGIDVVLLGGRVRRDFFAVVGPIAQDTLGAFQLDKAFLGTGGIDLKRGLSNTAEEEIPLKKMAARLARKTIVLADRTKIGKGRVHYFLPWTAFDLFITDADKGVVTYPGRRRHARRT